jgi:hypothetical protein
MYYAHKGNATDGHFNSERSFYAFDSKAERKAAQDKIWKDSDGERNLIFCTRKFVETHESRNFVVFEDGRVLSGRAAHE